MKNKTAPRVYTQEVRDPEKSSEKIFTKGKRIEISSKELKINLEKLQQDVKNAYETMRKVLPSAIKDVEVKKFGNASHIVLPKEFTGKKAIVLIKK